MLLGRKLWLFAPLVIGALVACSAPDVPQLRSPAATDSPANAAPDGPDTLAGPDASVAPEPPIPPQSTPTQVPEPPPPSGRVGGERKPHVSPPPFPTGCTARTVRLGVSPQHPAQATCLPAGGIIELIGDPEPRRAPWSGPSSSKPDVVTCTPAMASKDGTIRANCRAVAAGVATVTVLMGSSMREFPPDALWTATISVR